MEVIETDGIVLKTMDFKEKDCILTFLTTKVGKKAGILHGGKSLRSGNAAKAELFVLNYFELFEKICYGEKNSPNFVASVLCSTITNLQRKGLDSTLLKNDQIYNTFELLKNEKITKESIEIIFEQIMSGKASTALDAMEKASITQLSEDELEKIVDEIIEQNSDKIKQEGMRSISSIMGIVMKQVRGKTSGSLVNELLKTKIQAIIK